MLVILLNVVVELLAAAKFTILVQGLGNHFTHTAKQIVIYKNK
jgi:hypothetical protein